MSEPRTPRQDGENLRDWALREFQESGHQRCDYVEMTTMGESWPEFYCTGHRARIGEYPT